MSSVKRFISLVVVFVGVALVVSLFPAEGFADPTVPVGGVRGEAHH